MCDLFLFPFFSLFRIEVRKEAYPKGLSLDGGFVYVRARRIVAWSHKRGCLLVMDYNKTETVLELPYDQFFLNCKLPGGKD